VRGYDDITFGVALLTPPTYRVLKYSPPIVLGAFPDGVIGPPYVNFFSPSNLRFDVAGNLYVSDTLAYRLVCPSSPPLSFLFLLQTLFSPPQTKKVFISKEETSKSVGAVASHVYGQSNLSSETQEPISATSLNYAVGLTLADGMVVVCSADENRVMVFPPGPPASNNIPAIRVLGQPSFTSGVHGSTLDRMILPYGVVYDNVANTLWVADTLNNRILSFKDFIVQVLQNLTSLDVVIAFQGRQPTVFVYPKGLFLRRD